ncbi:MAG: sodium:solute symporter [Flavobacteriales bacterium]|nr:sodium:solute symporter [Flavobacteriales bacterium]
MRPELILIVIGLYFALLLGISWFTSRNADSKSYFIGNKKSIWWLVALGMVSDSLSGVTFISVPGNVNGDKLSYMQVVFGYVIGNIITAYVLLPLYYRLNLTSIYSYLGQRFGENTQKTGSFYFLLSRTLGAAARLFLAAGVLQTYLFDPFGIPFTLSIIIIIGLILMYTYRGGIKSLVFTDALQSTFLLLALFLTLYNLYDYIEWGSAWSIVKENEFDKIFVWDWLPSNNFFKMILGGVLVAVTMTGMDQNMMQKNLSCKNIGEARKNILSYNSSLIFINFFFLSLGVLLYVYATQKGITLPSSDGKIITDQVFPFMAFNHLGEFAGLVFILGLTAATFSSADSVLTTLTTSFLIDFLKFNPDETESDEHKKTRHIAHILFAVAILASILLIEQFNEGAIIITILTIAGYTYGPLLGLFAFGMFNKSQVYDNRVLWVCILAPILTFFINKYIPDLTGGFQLGFLILALNGWLTYAGLWLIRKKSPNEVLEKLS